MLHRSLPTANRGGAVLLAALGATIVLRADSFTPTARMLAARSRHQATLLTDGTVLVSGGSDDFGAAIRRAELFNPVTRTWTETGPNVVARLDHVATLLQDGRVLVAGGAATSSSCESFPIAETYDPTAGTWSPTSDVPLAFGHGPVAAQIADHRVLVSGGGSPCGDVSRSAALFDAATNTWSTTSPMIVARQFHTAVVLADRRVLVTGGGQDGSDVDAEAYDPDTATWTIVPRPQSAQGTACDGYLPSFAALLEPRPSMAVRATAAGCSSSTILTGRRFLVAGGVLSGRRLDSAEVFDPRLESRTLTGRLVTPRAGHTATRLLNGSVLVAGGDDGVAPMAASEVYIPEIPYRSSIYANAIGRGGVDRNGERFYGGVLAAALNSRRHLFVSYTHGRPTTRMLEWDLTESGLHGRYVREIGEGVDEFHSVRIDKNDNIWAVGSTTNEVFEFNPAGALLFRFGAPPALDADAPAVLPLARPYLDHPLDMAWDGAGNIFVVDGGRNPRLAKFDRRGRFIAAAGSLGAKPGELRSPHALAVDADGKVYVADGGNARIQVFSNALALLAVYDTVGSPWAMCITNGAHQYLFSASNLDRTDNTKGDRAGEIYKLELDGTIVGRLGQSDNASATLLTPHFISCSGENELIAIGISDSGQTITLLPR